MADNLIAQKAQNVSDMLDAMDVRAAGGQGRPSGLPAPQMLPPTPAPSLFGFLGDRKKAIDTKVKSFLNPAFMKAFHNQAKNFGNQAQFFQALNKTPDLTLEKYSKILGNLDILAE